MPPKVLVALYGPTMKLASCLFLLAALGGTSAFSPQPSTKANTALHTASTLPPQDSGPNIFSAVGDLWKREVSNTFEASADDVVIEPDFTLAWLFALSGFGIYLQNIDPSCFNARNIIPIGNPGLFPGIFAFLHVWFGSFLADRAMRLRVVFTPDKLVMKNLYDAKTGNKLSENEMTLREKNYVVGGTDGWNYDHFINWEFFPSVHMPVLVYFKEDQTDSKKWNVGPGAYDKRNNGMVHFFPAFGNSHQIKREFKKRNLSKIEKNIFMQ